MSVNDLLQCLKKSRLLSDKQFDAVSRSVRSKRGQLTPEKVVDSLVKQELLTEWQGRMLLRKQSGFVLGQYTLLVPIGSGGMGKVFKAWDKTGQRHVAIKVLSRKLAKNKKLVARFRREIELASRLDSPYIVRAFDAGEVGESHFMVMEYVDGEGLDELAERLGRIRAEHACELIRQAALGLQFAHEQGMVHRDIKPANMILSFADGTPVLKLLDMGLARIEKVENDGMTRTGQVMGTPDYMAPEQGWNTADVDIRADIYSLGCSLFRLVTGSVPFRGDNPLQVLMARCSTDAPLASSIVPDLDARIDAVIRGMTWRDPSKRYQTPGEVAAALAPLAEIPGDDDFAGGNAASTPVARPTVVADSTSGEPSFQGFLRDMDGGSPVSLFDGSATDTSPGGTATEKIKPRTRARGKRNLLLAGAGGVLLLFVAGFLAGGYGGSGDVDQKKANAAQQAARRPVYLADVAPQSVQAGQVVSFTMAPDIPVDGDDMEYQLAAGAPESATLDPHTGEFYWIPDRTQDPGRVAIRVQARRGEQMVDERVVYVDVRAAPLTARILPFKDVELTEGEAWTRQIELFGVDSSTVDVRFALVGDPPAGLQLDANSGLLQWTPDTAAIGRHDLNIELRDPRNDKIVDAATCSLMVRPAGGRRPRLVALPAQTIEAGQQLVVDLTTDQPLPPTVALRLAPGSPPGARLDDNRRFVWTPPADSSGHTPIRVRLQQDGRVIGQADASRMPGLRVGKS